MLRTFLAVILGVAIGATGVVVASRVESEAKEKMTTVTKLMERDIQEVVDGKPTKLVVVEVAMDPGAVGSPHRHPGPVFGYILEGQYELKLGGQPPRLLKAGETFYEPTGILHDTSINSSNEKPTRILAVMLMARDVPQLSTPAASER